MDLDTGVGENMSAELVVWLCGLGPVTHILSLLLGPRGR